jgi:hypothetical protein
MLSPLPNWSRNALSEAMHGQSLVGIGVLFQQTLFTNGYIKPNRTRLRVLKIRKGSIVAAKHPANLQPGHPLLNRTPTHINDIRIPRTQDSRWSWGARARRWLLSIRRIQSRTTPKRITGECKMACAAVNIGREGILPIREQELEGAVFANRRWRDFEVKNSAEVVRGYERGMG